jgi:hypothetical protein
MEKLFVSEEKKFYRIAYSWLSWVSSKTKNAYFTNKPTEKWIKFFNENYTKYVFDLLKTF